MLDKLTLKIGQWVIKKFEGEKDDDDLEVFVTGLAVIINTVSIILLTLIISHIISNLALLSIVTMIAFSALRFFSGGFHIKSNELCIIVSTILLVVCTYVSSNYQIPLFLNWISVVAILLFAPYTPRINLKDNRTKYVTYKIVSILFLLINFILFKSDVLTITFLAQSLTIINPKKIGALWKT